MVILVQCALINRSLKILFSLCSICTIWRICKILPCLSSWRTPLHYCFCPTAQTVRKQQADVDKGAGPACAWEGEGAASWLSTEIGFWRCNPGLQIQDCGETICSGPMGAYLGCKNILVWHFYLGSLTSSLLPSCSRFRFPIIASVDMFFFFHRMLEDHKKAYFNISSFLSKDIFISTLFIPWLCTKDWFSMQFIKLQYEYIFILYV